VIVNLGWSDGGYSELRAADADRAEVRRLLDVARDEGRLDEAEFDRRSGAVRAAKTRGDLVRVTTDLPERKGVREWIDGMRVRGTDREDARRWLAEAAAQDRLGDQEHERRLVALSQVARYAELTIVLDGVPGRPGTARSNVLAGATDRESALATLAEAVADGRVRPVEAPALEADIRQARRVGDLDALLAPLPERAGARERQDVVEALATAHRDGQLDVAEYAARAGQAREAVLNAELAPLVAELRGDARRLTDADRQSVADTLKRALEEGRLDLAEFDERVRVAHAATTVADVAPLVADLVSPPRPASRHWWDAVFDAAVVNSALVTAPRRGLLKLIWYAATSATLLTYAYLVTWNYLVTLVALWLPLWGLLALEGFVVELLAGRVWSREQAIIDGLRADLDRLRAKQPDITAITLEYPAKENVRDDDGDRREKTRRSVAQIRVEFDRTKPNRKLAAQFRDEITRLLWRSRLYPLHKIWLGEPGTTSTLGTVKSNGPEAEKLRHRHGPRPYGPFPEQSS